MAELEINGVSYRTGRLTPMLQFHVMRRLAPLLSGIGEAIKVAESSQKIDETARATVVDALLKTAAPIVDAIGSMDDQQAEYVINTCLSVVERKDHGAWAHVQTPTATGPILMFPDIDLPVMLQLCYLVVQENLSGFFSVSPPAVGGAPFKA
jgi:hypothetical protein